MIRRTVHKMSKPAEKLQEASFTSTKGIDVTSPPTQRESSLELTNLDVNLDGSLSLRKPLLFHKQFLGSVICDYIFNNHILVLDSSGLYVSEEYSTNVKDIYYGDNVVDLTFLSDNGIDLTSCNITNTGTSTILSNVKVDLKFFENGKYYNSTIGDAYYNDESFITSTYFKLEYSKNKYILKYIKPDIANLNSSETISLNPNTATYYTFAVRDNYKSAVTSVEGILAYTTNDNFENETVADLTESAKHSIIESVPNDFSDSVILKAFMNIAYSQSARYYILWEKTYDNITWSEVPEFYNNFKTEILKIEDTSRLNESLEDTSENYIYRRAVVLETPNKENDYLPSRPDVIVLKTLDRAIYRCSIYAIYNDKIKYLSRDIRLLENIEAEDFAYDGSIIRLMKSKSLTDTSFSIKYYVKDTFDFISGSFSIQMVVGDNVHTISPIMVGRDTEKDEEGNVIAHYLTLSSTKPYTGTFKKLLYDVRTVGIFIHYDNLFFDAIRYSVTGYDTTPSTSESNQINVPILASGPGIRGDGTFVYEIDYRDMLRHSVIDSCIEDILTNPLNGGTLTNFNSDTKKYGNPILFFDVEAIRDVISSEIESGLLDGNYQANDIVLTYKDYFGNSREKTLKYNSDFWKYYQYAIDGSKSHFYYTESMQGVDSYKVLGIYRNDREYTLDIAAFILNEDSFTATTGSPTATKNWILANYNSQYCISLANIYPIIDIQDPSESELESIIDDIRLLSVKQWNFTISDSVNIIQSDISNTCKGKKLYYKNKIYTYGVEQFKNNIFVSDTDSFVTPLYNIVDLNMTSESMVTTLLPWRDYLIAASESGIYLIQGSGEEVTSKAINTYIGIPNKDSATCKAILNGIVFKSGSKIYSLQPSMYSSDDTILNIVDISKPVANYIKDTIYDNFAFTTERAYYLFIPDENTTTCLKYEYARKIWTKYEYPVRLYKYHIQSVDDIYVFSSLNKIFYFEKDISFVNDIIPEEIPNLQYGDYLSAIRPYSGLDVTKCEAITFKLDSGQKTDNLSITKQFVESKFLLATMSDKDMFPIDVSIYIDGLHFKNVHVDASTDSSFWKTNSQELGSLSTNFTNDNADVFNTLRQMFIRYSGKGKTIRHVVSGVSNFNFKIYVIYYRYKISHNKQ